MLHYLKSRPNGVTAVADQRIKRLYDKRDELWDRLEIMIGVRDLGKPPAELDWIERAKVRLVADRAIEALEDAGDSFEEPPRDAIDQALNGIVRVNFEAKRLMFISEMTDTDSRLSSPPIHATEPASTG